MNIGTALRDLGTFHVEPLLQAVTALEEDAPWFAQKHRQNAYEVHKDTSSIVLLFCDDEWPDATVNRDLGWDLLADVAIPIMDKIIADKYQPGGRYLRAMAARLHAGRHITPHTDKLPSFHAAHRIHIPLITNPGVRYMIGGRPFSMEVGNAYEINNQKLHSVINAGDKHRVNFIFDYQPPTE